MEVLRAARLPDLCRQVCEYVGIPTRPGQTTTDRFTIHCGGEPPELLAKLLQEALADDAPTVAVDPGVPAPGEVVVREGDPYPWPIPQEVWQAAGGVRVVVFTAERRGLEGELRDVVWAAISEEVDQEAPLKAAVSRQILGAGR
jgi:hypothetical protein